MTEALPNAEEIVAEYWPVHGPYSPERAETAAQTVRELVRYLNYSTGRGAHQALPHAAHFYTVVGALTGAAGGLDQTLRQLTARAAALAEDPTLGYCEQHTDLRAAHAEATAAGESLTAARQALSALYAALNAAHSHLGPLYHREES